MALYPAPPNDEANWYDPSEAEALTVSGSFASALGGPKLRTAMQVMTISAITHSMTGFGFDLDQLPAVSPDDLARTLKDRGEPWRNRIVHVMLIGALLLEDIPESLQANLEEFATALGVNDDMLGLTSRLADGSKSAALLDFQRSGYEGNWSAEAFAKSLGTTEALESAWDIVEDGPELAQRWAALEKCTSGWLVLSGGPKRPERFAPATHKKGGTSRLLGHLDFR